MSSLFSASVQVVVLVALVLAFLVPPVKSTSLSWLIGPDAKRKRVLVEPLGGGATGVGWGVLRKKEFKKVVVFTPNLSFLPKKIRSTDEQQRNDAKRNKFFGNLFAPNTRKVQMTASRSGTLSSYARARTTLASLLNSSLQ